MGPADEAVLGSIEQDLLQPAVVERALARALELLHEAGGASPAERAQLVTELATVERELQHLGTAIAQTGPVPAFLAQAQERDRRRTALTERLAALETAAQTGARTSAAVHAELRSRLTEWRALLRRQVTQARQILRKLLVGRLAFTPAPDEQGKCFRFHGQGSLGRVLEGVAGEPPHAPLVQGVTSLWRFEPALISLVADQRGHACRNRQAFLRN